MSQRQTINVNLNPTATEVATFNIYFPPLRFIPTKLIVRQITGTTTPNAGAAYQIVTNLIDDQILCTFIDAVAGLQTQNLENTFLFMPSKQISGSYLFQICSVPSNAVGPGPVTSTLGGNVSFTLEFIKD